MSLREISFPPQAVREQWRPRILVAGSRDLVRDCARQLANGTMTVIKESHGHRALERLCTERFDAAIIDLELSPFDDFCVISSWRLTDIPIISITSKVDAADAIEALEMGADDYIRKLHLKEDLGARLWALLRRTTSMQVPEEPVDVISVGALVIDESAFKVWKRGQEISLSATEFKLLLALVREEGRVLTREVLVEKAWGYKFLGSSRLVDMTIARLRSKIEDRPKQPEYVLTARGIGYQFQIPTS